MVQFQNIHSHTLFSYTEGRGCSNPRRTGNTSRFTAISDSFVGSTTRRGRSRSEM